MQKQTKRDPYRLVGTILGDYRILEFVGSGGMGAVYRAHHQFIGDTVALKILKPDLANVSPRTRKQLEQLFLDEARNTRLLDHPRIVRVTDAGVAEEITFLVMEWLDGHTLDQELEREGRLPTQRVATLLEDVCDGMAHAHNKGIVHRDLKPANIMVVQDDEGEERVKILDFGIAKALNSINSRVIGAPYYASPEQLNVGLPIDQRSDVYSLGVMIYEMLTGKLPFDDTSIGTVINQHLNSAPPLLRKIQPEISEPMEEMVLKALAKRPDDRYQSVRELALAFRLAANLDAGTLIVHCLDAANGSPVAKASIYLNGKYAGPTNDQGKWLRENLVPREYALDVACDRYLPWKKRVSISARDQLHVEAELKIKQVGQLSIRTVTAGSAIAVSGAEILLRGKLIGATDKIGLLRLPELPPGKFEIEVRHPDRQFNFTREIEIVHGQETHLDIEFPHETKTVRRSGPRLRRVMALAALIPLALAVVAAYRFIQHGNQREQLLNAITEASQYNDAGLRLYDSGRVFAALPESQRAENVPLIKASFELAALKFQKAVDLDSRRDDYYYNWGRALLFLGEFERAQNALKSAVKLSPSNGEYRLASEALGRMLLNCQARDSAGPAYVRSKGPSLSLYYFERGNAFFGQKASDGRPNYKCAEFEYRQAGDLDTRNAEIYYMRGVCLDAQFNYNDSIPMFEQALALDPQVEKYSNWKRDFASERWPEPKADEFRHYRSDPCEPVNK